MITRVKQINSVYVWVVCCHFDNKPEEHNKILVKGPMSCFSGYYPSPCVL